MREGVYITHCSECGRRIRVKTVWRWPGSGGGTAPYTDYLNHLRSCPRYGLPPDA